MTSTLIALAAAAIVFGREPHVINTGVQAAFIPVTKMTAVDQTALWRRDEAGEIRAAIDVFAPGPPRPMRHFAQSGSF